MFATNWDGIDELYERLMPDAVRLAYLITGDIGVAEDVVQDTFMKMATRYRKTMDEPYIQSYFNKAVVREVTSHRRRVTARLKRQSKAIEKTSPPGDDHHTTEQRVVLLQHLQVLPVKPRTVLVFTYFFDYSDQQICDITKWPIGTIKSLRSRALATLRKDLGDDRAAGRRLSKSTPTA